MQMPWSLWFLWIENMLAIGCSVPNGKLSLYHEYAKLINCLEWQFNPSLIFLTQFLDRPNFERQIWQRSWSSPKEKTREKDAVAKVWEIQASYGHRSGLSKIITRLLRIWCQKRIVGYTWTWMWPRKFKHHNQWLMFSSHWSSNWNSVILIRSILIFSEKSWHWWLRINVLQPRLHNPKRKKSWEM